MTLTPLEFFLTYSVMTVVTPFVVWIISFITSIISSVIGRKHLADGDLNAFNMHNDPDYCVIFLLGTTALWPLGLGFAAGMSLFSIIASIFTGCARIIEYYAGGSRTGNVFDFPKLTENLNRRIKQR